MPALSTRRVNGEGSVYFYNERWYATLEIGIQSNGKPKVKRFSSKTKSGAIRKKEEYKKSMMIFSENDPNVTVEEYFKYWLTNFQIYKIKPQSYDRLESTVYKHIIPSIGFLMYGTVETRDIQILINKKYMEEDLSYSSVKKIYDALNACFKFNLSLSPAEKILEYNPCAAVILPQNKKSKRDLAKIFKPDEIVKIKNEIDRKYIHRPGSIYPYGYLYILILNTGLRLSESLALNKTDIDLVNRKIYIGSNYVRYKNRKANKNSGLKYINCVEEGAKTKTSERWVSLNNAAVNACKRLFEQFPNTECLCLTKTGRRASEQCVESTFRKILERSGVEKNGRAIHSLRHTFASMLIRQGVDAKTVSDILGHSSVKITLDIYTHLFEEQKIKAVNQIPDIC